MANFRVCRSTLQTLPDMDEAAGAGGGRHVRRGFFQLVEQPASDFFRYFRLGQMKQSSLTAALRAVGEFDQAQTGDGPEDIPGRSGNPGVKPQVAGVVVDNGAYRV